MTTSIPERAQEIVIPDWDDACQTCGACYDIISCGQCGKPLCGECASPAGRCGTCESYDLPANFTVVPDTAYGFRSRVDIRLGSERLADVPGPLVFWYDDPGLKRVVTVKCRTWPGAGFHYHTDLEEDEDPVWHEREGAWVVARNHNDEDAGGRRQWSVMTCDPKTPNEAARWAKARLIERYGHRPTLVVIASSEIRQWFYRREGD